MKLTKHSRNRLMESFHQWQVPKDFADPMYNYLVHGFEPGSCFTSVLANDFYNAIRRSHPANTVEAFKSLAGWIHDYVPRQAIGSYQAVENWTKMDQDARRAVLENFGLIYTKEEEVMLVLAGEQTVEPTLY
jgi:hypothetical protein